MSENMTVHLLYRFQRISMAFKENEISHDTNNQCQLMQNINIQPLTIAGKFKKITEERAVHKYGKNKEEKTGFLSHNAICRC